MHIKSYGMTEIGRQRAENQDVFLADGEAGIYIIADGMGGMESGGEAAAYVVQSLYQQLNGRLPEAYQKGPEGVTDLLVRTIEQINDALRRRISPHSGSTVAIFAVIENTVFAANLGDSVGYLFRDGMLTQLTQEHNMAGNLIRSGELTREEAKFHPARHRLTAYVGMSGRTETYVSHFELQDGDRLLLCSDGLTGMVPETEIAAVLAEETDLEAAIHSLIGMANDAGGYDNIAAVLLECVC